MTYDQLIEETCDFWIPPGNQVPYVHNPSPIEFLRDYVAQNKPCILTGIMQDWPAMKLWDSSYLSEIAGDSLLHINLTPDGNGDCIRREENLGEVFVKPYEQEMTMKTFFECLSDTGSNVAYLSHQNDNLREELTFLKQDVPPIVDLVKDIFGPLDAVNLWIGDERAVSAMHMDHYENLYGVIEGEKVFHLLPPCVNVLLEEVTCPQARFHPNQNNELIATLEVDESPITWIKTDPSTDSFRQGLAGRALVECRVKRGELLYLPAMWLHRATQSSKTIAVNYWHDQTFDLKWVYYSELMRGFEK